MPLKLFPSLLRVRSVKCCEKPQGRSLHFKAWCHPVFSRWILTLHWIFLFLCHGYNCYTVYMLVTPNSVHSVQIWPLKLRFEQWTKSLLAISVRKDVAAISPLHYSCPEGDPWGNSGWRQMGCHCQAHLVVNHCSYPWQCTLRRLRMRKLGTLAPDSWAACQRNDFSDPRLSHLTIYRKALNSLTWNIWFSFIKSNQSGLLLQKKKKLLHILVLPLTSLEQFLRVIWNAVSQAWVLTFVLQIKHNSQLLGCAFFSVDNSDLGMHTDVLVFHSTLSLLLELLILISLGYFTAPLSHWTTALGGLVVVVQSLSSVWLFVIP